MADIRHADGTLDLARLMAASEGTLGLFTCLELSVAQIPQTSGLSLLYFDSLEAAGEAVLQIGPMNPSMLEIMEYTFINLVRQSAFSVGVPFPANLKVMLLVEFDGDSTEEVNEKLETMERLLIGPGKPAMSARRGVDQAERDRLQKVRKAASPILNRIPPPKRPMRFIEDGVVPIHRLPEYILGLHRIFDKYETPGIIFGHAGDGNIHVNPFMNAAHPDFKVKIECIARETMELIKSLEGSLSGEHGDGLLRSPYLPEMAGPAYSAFQRLKDLFDPSNILNPGIIVGGDQYRITDNLKIYSIDKIRRTDTILDDPMIAGELRKCSGCGACRSYCPVFLATREEMTTPRAKANLLHQRITQNPENPAAILGSGDRPIIDFCIGCNTCTTECPAGVDIPGMMQLAKNVHNDSWGLSLSDRLIAGTDRLGFIGSQLPTLTNKILKNSVFRQCMDWFFNIDMRRKLPEYSSESLNNTVAEMTLGTGGKRIVYFPGCFSRHHDPSGEGMAIIAILVHHGYSPIIPQTNCCGIAELSIGNRDAVIPAATANIAILDEFIKGGVQIITGSPSCGLALRHEYRQLIPSEAANRVSERVMDIHELLAEFLGEGKLSTEMQPLDYHIAIHQPCHLRAQGLGTVPEELLRLIPRLKITILEPKCCGIAGTFGLKKHNYDLAKRIGTPLFNQIENIKPDFVVTPCGTCRMQFEQETNIPTLHPASLLAEAYSLIHEQKGMKLQ